MKKTISSALIASILLPGLAFAFTIPVSGGTVDCDTSIFTDATTNATSTATDNQLVGCHGGNGSPMLMMEAWGLTAGDSQSLVFPSGRTVADAAGITFDCPFFYPQGCFNLTGLDYWKHQARTIAQQTDGAGLFAYWLTH